MSSEYWNGQCQGLEMVSWSYSFILSVMKLRVVRRAGPDVAALHLIAVHDSGAARVFNLKLDSKGVWNIHSATKNPFKTSVSHSITSFVINPDGSDTKPTPEALQALPTENPRRTSLSKAPTSPNLRSLWILASSKECRCFLDVTGERVARVDWTSPVKHVEMVSRTGGCLNVPWFPCREILPSTFKVDALSLHSRRPVMLWYIRSLY
jgi:hypothetical protein